MDTLIKLAPDMLRLRLGTDKSKVVILLLCVLGVMVTVGAIFWVISILLLEHTSMKIEFNWTILGFISLLTIVDLAAKKAIYSGLPSIQSVTTDIVILSLGFVISFTLWDAFQSVNQILSESSYNPDVFLVTASYLSAMIKFPILALCYFATRLIFREQYISKYHEKARKVFGEHIENKPEVLSLFTNYKHPELWVLFRKDEVQEINKALNAISSSEESIELTPMDLSLCFRHRMKIVASLAAVATVALAVSCMQIGFNLAC